MNIKGAKVIQAGVSIIKIGLYMCLHKNMTTTQSLIFYSLYKFYYVGVYMSHQIKNKIYIINKNHIINITQY